MDRVPHKHITRIVPAWNQVELRVSRNLRWTRNQVQFRRLVGIIMYSKYDAADERSRKVERRTGIGTLVAYEDKHKYKHKYKTYRKKQEALKQLSNYHRVQLGYEARKQRERGPTRASTVQVHLDKIRHVATKSVTTHSIPSIAMLSRCCGSTDSAPNDSAALH